MRLQSIRTRLLVVILMLVIIPPGLISIIVGQVGRQNLQEQVRRQLSSVAYSRQASVKRWVRSQERSLAAMLTIPVIRREVHAALKTREGGGSARKALLTQMHDYARASGNIDEIFLLDARGWVIAASNPRIVGDYRGLQAYFTEGKKETGTHVATFSYSSSTEEVNALISVIPLRNAQGEAYGVLAGQVSLAQLNEIMKAPPGLDRTAETYLVGANHILLTETITPGYEPGGTYIGTMAANAALRDHGIGNGVYPNYSEEQVIGVHTWIPELRVGLVAEQATSEAFQPIRRLMWFSALVTAAAILAAIVVSVLVTRSITQPLEHLADTATRIAGGELNLTAQVNRVDEVGKLAWAFNAMTGQLRSMLVRLHLLLDASRDAIFIYELQDEGSVGCFTEVNQTACKWLGYSKEQLKTLTPYDVAPPDERERLRKSFKLLNRSKHGITTETLVSKSGEIIPAEFSVQVVEINNRPTAIAIARDISERNRTHALATATEGILAKGRMAAYVAHEINSPLAGIKNAFLLLGDAISPDHPYYKYVDLIHKEIKRISNIVKMMYELYRPTTQAPADVLMEALLQDVETLLEPKARAQQVELLLELPDPDLRATLSADLLRQILINMLQNAMEASPPKSVVRCRALRQGDRLSIQVVDEGPGVAPEVAPRIFDHGFSTKHTVGTQMGLGLGLGSSRRLAQGMGGSLVFANNMDGGGCTFTLDLPLSQSVDSEE